MGSTFTAGETDWGGAFPAERVATELGPEFLGLTFAPSACSLHSASLPPLACYFKTPSFVLCGVTWGHRGGKHLTAAQPMAGAAPLRRVWAGQGCCVRTSVGLHICPYGLYVCLHRVHVCVSVCARLCACKRVCAHTPRHACTHTRSGPVFSDTLSQSRTWPGIKPQVRSLRAS